MKKRRDAFSLEQIMMLVTKYSYMAWDTGEQITLPAPGDVVDPTGALRLIILIATFTDRRFEAILQLLVEDVVYGVSHMREVLEEADEEARPAWVSHFPHGLLDFRREWDKEKHHWPVPICRLLRGELDSYPARRGLISGPLFPLVRDPQKPLAQSTVSRNPWQDPKTGRTQIGRFDRAWRLARKYLTDAGQDPDHLMPLRRGYKLHRIRGFMATHLEKLGYGRANRGEDS